MNRKGHRGHGMTEYRRRVWHAFHRRYDKFALDVRCSYLLDGAYLYGDWEEFK